MSVSRRPVPGNGPRKNSSSAVSATNCCAAAEDGRFVRSAKGTELLPSYLVTKAFLVRPDLDRRSETTGD